MDLEQLRTFVTVAEELHFGRAALRLGLSQPQVSRRVRALEESLGLALFVRTPRRTALTDAGARLLDDARETLDAADRLERRAAAAGRSATGRVTVGFIWSTVYRELEDGRSPLLLIRRPEPPPPAVAAIDALARELFGDADLASNNGHGAVDLSRGAS
jgi:Bacterial regulatory helix-turn-helix protein, lysR family